jgi:hypothetical protein
LEKFAGEHAFAISSSSGEPVIVRIQSAGIDEQQLFKECDKFLSHATSLRPRFATRSLNDGELEVFVIRDDPKIVMSFMLAVGTGLAIIFALYWPQALPVAFAVCVGCTIGTYAYLNSFPLEVVVARISPDGRISRAWCERVLELLPDSVISVVRVHGFPGDMTYLYALTVSSSGGNAEVIACSQFKSFVLSLKKSIDSYYETTSGRRGNQSQVQKQLSSKTTESE